MDGHAATRIREAIAHEQYGEALRLWQSHTEQVARAIEAGTFSTEEMAELRELYDWIRTAALSARAHLRERYRSVTVAAAYCARPRVPR